MIADSSASQASIAPAPVDTVADAERLVVRLMDAMDSLLGVVEEETTLVRAGRVSTALRLETAKSDLARIYVAAVLQVQASQAFMAEAMPDILQQLHRRHETFRSLLQVNLTVLATAHAVAEGIVRGVSDEMTRKSSPETYEASGRAAVLPRRAAVPLAVSRVL